MINRLHLMRYDVQTWAYQIDTASPDRGLGTNTHPQVGTGTLWVMNARFMPNTALGEFSACKVCIIFGQCTLPG